jgi:hypothetical protein
MPWATDVPVVNDRMRRRCEAACCEPTISTAAKSRAVGRIEATVAR